MPNKKQQKTKTVKVKLGGRTVELVDQLVRFGLFGNDRSEVCERFIYEGLQRAAAAGHVETKE